MKLAGVCSDSSRHPAGRRMDPLLQHLELQPVADHHHDLAVDHAPLRQVGLDRLDHLGEVAGHRLLVARADLDLVAVAEHDRAEAVPLGLVGQLAGRDLGHRLGQHRRDGRHHGQLHAAHCVRRIRGWTPAGVVGAALVIDPPAGVQPPAWPDRVRVMRNGGRPRAGRRALSPPRALGAGEPPSTLRDGGHCLERGKGLRCSSTIDQSLAGSDPAA